MPSGDANVYLRVRLGSGTTPEISRQVISVDVQDEDRGTDFATVVVDNQGMTNTEAIRVGNEVRIEMGWESEHALLFVGRVHRTQTAAHASGSSRLSFTCRDLSMRMCDRPTTANRQHVGTLEEILTALATEASIEMGKVLIDPMPSWTEGERGPLNQGTRTTWQMIQDLAEEYRSRAFVEVNSSEKDTAAQREAGGVPLLYFVSEEALLNQKPLGKLRYCAGYGSLLEFEIQRVGSGAAPSAETTVVDEVSGEVRTESGPEPAVEEPAALTAGQTHHLTAAGGEARARGAEASIDHANQQPVQPADVRPRSRVAGTPSDPGLARRLVMQDPTRVLGLFGRGLAMGTVFLRAKGSVEIDGLASSANGRWYVRRVNHIIEQTSERSSGARGQTRKTYRTRIEVTR
jgi:phage protein D